MELWAGKPNCSLCLPSWHPSLYATVTAVQGVHTPRCLLVTVKLHSRARDNSCTVGAIAFKKAWMPSFFQIDFKPCRVPLYFGFKGFWTCQAHHNLYWQHEFSWTPNCQSSSPFCKNSRYLLNYIDSSFYFRDVALSAFRAWMLDREFWVALQLTCIYYL